MVTRIGHVALHVSHLDEEPELRELYDHELVLVRPDLHIGWRGAYADDPAGIIDLARGARAHDPSEGRHR